MSSLDEISHAIGELRGQVMVLTRIQAEHNDETAKIREKLADLHADVQVVKRDVIEFKPAARKVQKWEQRAVGMSLIGGVFGGGVLAYLRGKLGL